MSETTRTRLLEAAERILIEQGVHALTVRRVGTVAGLNATLVTYHFKTISGLLDELCQLNLIPMMTEWEWLDSEDGPPDFETVLQRWLQPFTRPAAFTPDGRALIVLDEIAAHGETVVSGRLLAAMVGISAKVHAALLPQLPGLSAFDLRARLRFISAAALGPPPRTRIVTPLDGVGALDSFEHLVAFARAALKG